MTHAARPVPASPTARPACFYFAGIDWNHTWQRPQQLAVRLAALGPLTYINPLGLRTPRLRDWRRLVKRLFGKRPVLESSVALAVTVRDPLPYLPWPHAAAAIRFNAWRLERLVRSRPSVMREAWFWVGTPSPAVLRMLDRCGYDRIVYDALDDFAAFPGLSPRLRQVETRLAKRARVVLTVSSVLQDRFSAINSSTHLIPNAAEVDRFAKGGDTQQPDELRSLPRPLLGYVGEIAPWLDVELLENLSARLPGASLVLVGQVHGETGRRLQGRPNVHFLGRRPYARLPGYLSAFDVCLLPFKLTPLTRAADPVKLYEYLAAGKPVVATALDATRRFARQVHVATPEGFPAAVERALEQAQDPHLARERRQAVQDDNWDARAATVGRILNAAGLTQEP